MTYNTTPENTNLSVPIADSEISIKTLSSLLNTPTVPDRYRESRTGVTDMYAAHLYGRELGVGTMTAIKEFYLVNGQASMSGKLMCALIWRAGHKVVCHIKASSTTVDCYRRDPVTKELDLVGSVEYTKKDAEQAGLMDQGTYQKYPKTMLTWRAITMAAKIYYADLISGVGYIPTEFGLDHMMPHPDHVETIPTEFVDVVVPDEGLDLEAAVANVTEVFPEAEVVSEFSDGHTSVATQLAETDDAS